MASSPAKSPDVGSSALFPSKPHQATDQTQAFQVALTRGHLCVVPAYVGRPDDGPHRVTTRNGGNETVGAVGMFMSVNTKESLYELSVRPMRTRAPLRAVGAYEEVGLQSQIRSAWA